MSISCYNRPSAAATGLRPSGSPVGSSTYSWGLAPFFFAPAPFRGTAGRRHRRRRSQSPGLRALLSRRVSTITQRTVM